jgi:hypothetical protein
MLCSCAALVILGCACRADQPAASPETLIRLNVYPASVPKPALRYVLLPELKEMNPGNPIQNYLKCFMEQQRFFFDKEAFDRREKLLTMPLKQLPAQQLEDYGGVALRQADWAARLDTPDWEILLKLKTDGLGVLLPDVQQLRALGSALKVRFRAEVAMSRFDDAVRTAKTMLAMSRHLSEHPTFIGNLVGIAMVTLAIGPLEEMSEQPGSPNLFWALTYLPTPFVRLDKGAQGERVWLGPEFGGLDNTAPMNAEQLKRFIAHMDKLFGDGKPRKPGEGLQAWLDARTKDEARVSAARRRLVENGLAEGLVQQFPPDQVLLLDEKREFEARYDDLMKLLYVPIWQAEATDWDKRPKEPALFADAFVPAVAKVRRAQVRVDQRIALLRHVEALRLYASEHDGTLPGKLAEIPVPLPDDPFTGKPFRYGLSGNTAHLRGSPPPGMEKEPSFNVHYEITVQQGEEKGQK